MVTSMGTSVALPFSFSLRHRLALRLQGRQPAHGGVDRLGIDVSDATVALKKKQEVLRLPQGIALRLPSHGVAQLRIDEIKRLVTMTW